MDESHLPEDINRWPRDPFGLLGIPYGTDRRELRRAYARLIRVYKPEQHPEKFRRIRDAYELCQFHLRVYGSPAKESQGSEAPAKADPPDVQKDPQPIADSGQADTGGAASQSVGPAAGETEPSASCGPQPAKAALPARETAKRIEDQIECLWETARSGEAGRAYEGLLNLRAQGGSHEDLYLRLFWLATLWPECDPRGEARGWLVEGLQRCGVRGRILEAYMQEFEADPREAVSERFTEILRRPLPLSLRMELAARRWRQAGRLSRWDVVAADLEALRPEVRNEVPDTWGMLLLDAVEALVWQDEPAAVALLQTCRREAEQVGEGVPSLYESFARCDFLFELAADWRKMRTNSKLHSQQREQLRSLVHDSWRRPLSAVRRPLFEFFHRLIVTLPSGLELLDRLAAQSPRVLHHLGTLMTAMENERAAPCPQRKMERLQWEVLKFLDAHPKRKYDATRKAVLAFCLREALSFEQFTLLLLNLPRPHPTQTWLAEKLNKDIALQCLLKAYGAFWA
jgi:hypothetical protein